MADCPKPYYCYDYEPYPSQATCDTQATYLGGGSDLYLIKCGVTVTDPEDETEMQALVDAGSLILVSGIAGGFDEPSAVSVDDPTACGSTIDINFDRTLTFTDGKVSKDVVQWYNSMKGERFSGALLKECEQNRWNWVDASVLLTSSRIMPPKNGELQLITGVLKWRQFDDPVPYAFPL